MKLYWFDCGLFFSNTDSSAIITSFYFCPLEINKVDFTVGHFLALSLLLFEFSCKCLLFGIK